MPRRRSLPDLPSRRDGSGSSSPPRFPNDNTRKAYFCAIRRFDAWCTARNLPLLRLQPIVIAAYIKELQASLSVPSVKQHLAAIRMLFDYLVVGQVLPMNPAASVRGPKYVIKKGKTPVLSADEARPSVSTTADKRLVVALVSNVCVCCSGVPAANTSLVIRPPEKYPFML